MSPPPDGVNAQIAGQVERPPALTVSIGLDNGLISGKNVTGHFLNKWWSGLFIVAFMYCQA